jgi:hypothetical protein
MLRKLTVSIPVLAVLALSVPQADATITTATIGTPASPTFKIYDQDSPNTIAVMGTTDSSAPATDQVDLQCFFGPSSASHLTLATGVSLNPVNGAFSVPTANLNPVKQQTCTLRAVPAGTIPVSLASFAGPVLATGSSRRLTLSSGPNSGTLTDYYTWGEQLTGGDDYDSYGSCGLCDGYLLNSNLSLTTTTFFGNDWFSSRDAGSSSTRSEIQVDGVDAYAPSQAQQINPNATAGFPPLSYTYTQNPSNGNLTITESDPLVKCEDTTYPPSSTKCATFSETGVTVHRTISQQSDGHLVFITDRYVSTNGNTHNLDLLPQNDQRFSNPGSNGLNIAYRFPGESSFSTHVAGDVVSFSGNAPAAAYLNVSGSPDGTESSGQAAIVFDRPSSPATFTLAIPSKSSFHLHQTALATASCSPTLAFAYAQDYLAANVATLAQAALNRFTASPATVCSPPSSPSTASGPTGRRAAALKRCKKRKSAKARKKCRKRAKRLPF